jgi:hypothetical protein
MIEYSTNEGNNWSTIVNATEAGPSGYPWPIPDTASTNCLVRISDVLDANINDVSDSCFSIKSKPEGIILTDNGLPQIHSLLQNYPNPFNPSTTIKYALPKPEHVTITVYNTLGQEIEKLVNKPMPIGHHHVEFNAQNLPSGVYFYRIEAGEYVQTRKMLLVK